MLVNVAGVVTGGIALYGRARGRPRPSHGSSVGFLLMLQVADKLLGGLLADRQFAATDKLGVNHLSIFSQCAASAPANAWEM